MPTYRFLNKNTDEEWEEFMGISACEEYLSANPHIERLVNGAPMIVGGYGDRVKTDGGMQELLGRIGRANPLSPLAERYGDKGMKATKNREVVKKLKKKHNLT